MRFFMRQCCSWSSHQQHDNSRKFTKRLAPQIASNTMALHTIEGRQHCDIFASPSLLRHSNVVKEGTIPLIIPSLTTFFVGSSAPVRTAPWHPSLQWKPSLLQSRGLPWPNLLHIVSFPAFVWDFLPIGEHLHVYHTGHCLMIKWLWLPCRW